MRLALALPFGARVIVRACQPQPRPFHALRFGLSFNTADSGAWAALLGVAVLGFGVDVWFASPASAQLLDAYPERGP